MPNYPSLVYGNASEQEKAIAFNGLLRLKEQLHADVPKKDLDEHLLLATWNVRDLGKEGAKHGRRTTEDLFYIAEIIANFDLVAVQEVNDLKDWEIIMKILGKDWDYIATDVSEWADGGNGERMTFVYDTRKVWFRNVAGEVVLSRSKLITEDVEADDSSNTQGRQFARTPFLVAFQAGWFKFNLCTVHIYFGAESGLKLQRRIREIDGIARELSDRANLALKEKDAMILLGDFNIVHPDHKTMKALTKYGFKIPQPLKRPTNLNHDKYYDQIAIKTNDSSLIEFTEAENEDGKPNAGVFEIFNTIMREEDWELYRNLMKETTQGAKLETEEEFRKYFNEWKTYHLSDHKPLWVRIPIDDSRDYIQGFLDKIPPQD
jgi:endonuclease/exonuclease/phosphatase family metal-dependent hydrolase